MGSKARSTEGQPGFVPGRAAWTGIDALSIRHQILADPDDCRLWGIYAAWLAGNGFAVNSGHVRRAARQSGKGPRLVLRHLHLHRSKAGGDRQHAEFCDRLLAAQIEGVKRAVRCLVYENGLRLRDAGEVELVVAGEGGAWFGFPDAEVAEVRYADEWCEAGFVFWIRGYPERREGRYDKGVKGAGFIRVDERLAASFGELSAILTPRELLPGQEGQSGGPF